MSRLRNLERWLQHAVDLGLAGVVFVAPLLMGGRHDVGRLVLVVLVCATSLAWLFRQCLLPRARWNWSGAEWNILAGVALLCFQLVSLPTALVAKLSPRIPELLPVWSDQTQFDMGLGTWSQASLAPVATQGGLVMFLAYAILFLVVVQRIQSLGDVERLLRWIAIAAIGMAALGIAQFLFSNGKFLWVYDHPFRDTRRAVQGPFINPNHCAHFLALGIAPLIWLFHMVSRQTIESRNTHDAGAHFSRSSRRASSAANLVLILAMAIVAFAGVLTLSRGGLVALFLASFTCVAIYVNQRLLDWRFLAALAVTGLIAAGGVSIYGTKSLTNELASFGGTIDDLDHNASRRKLWTADLQAARDFPILGTGAGSHAEAYPIYYSDYSDVEHKYAESGYIQILLECGVAGIALLVIGVGACGYWCFRALWSAGSDRIAACAAVVATVLLVSLVHSIWDFVWYIPACASITVVIMACGCRLCQLSTRRDASSANRTAGAFSTKLSWATATVAAFFLSTLMIQDRLGPALAAPHWERYLRQTRPGDENITSEIDITLMIRALERSLEYDPRAPRAHARIANLYARHFDERQADALNPVTLIQVRNAAVASRFPSRQALDEWLYRAVGDNRKLLDKALHHAQQGLRLCPLQGDSYVDLAKLSFLDGSSHDRRGALIEQGLRVRPYSGAVLFAAGTDAAVSGDTSKAVVFWKRAFHHDTTYRFRIIDLLVPTLTAEQFIDLFDPDLAALGQLYGVYHGLGRENEATVVGANYAKRLEVAADTAPSTKASRLCTKAWRVYQNLNDDAAALRCLRRAVECAPGDYGLHRSLAIALISDGQFDQATDQLRWCRRRKPDDPVVGRLWARAEHQRSQQASMTGGNGTSEPLR
jgi:O-antigen ligase/tetratricopeptide (TPR) repeat protein